MHTPKGIYQTLPAIINPVMKTLLRNLSAVIALSLIALSAGFSVPQVPHAEAATNAIETPVALFQTSLANSVSSSATTLTLVSGLTKDGTTLASSTYAFILDEGTASEEFVIGDCTGTACTNLQRGLSVITGTTTISALQKTHGRGASVKITDAPLLLKVARMLNGIMGIPVPIAYNNIATSTIAGSRNNLASVGLLLDTAFNVASIIGATESSQGLVEIATAAEAAASTLNGSSGRLALPASIATSTWNSASSNANTIPVAGALGKIDNSYIATTTFFTNTNLLGTTTAAATSSVQIGAFSAWQIDKQMFVSTTTGTSTFAIPSGITKLNVAVCGAGGGGGGVNAGAGGGGGSGGCALRMVDVSGTSTVQYFIGTGGTSGSNTSGTTGSWSTFGTNGFYMSANGGSGGSNGGVGGAGGSSSGGDINTTGSTGTEGVSTSHKGTGASSMFGKDPSGGGDGCASSGACSGVGGNNGFLRIIW